MPLADRFMPAGHVLLCAPGGQPKGGEERLHYRASSLSRRSRWRESVSRHSASHAANTTARMLPPDSRNISRIW